MKKILVFIMLVVIIFSTNIILAFAEEKVIEAPNVKIIIDEKVLLSEDVPIIINERTMLPIRAVVTNLGVQNDDQHIIWDGKERSVTIIKDNLSIKLFEGNLTTLINEEPIILDAAPFMYSKNGRTYVPVRFIAQALNKAVVWEQATSSIYIHSMLNQQEMWEKMHVMANSKVITQDEVQFNSKKIETSYVNQLIAITEKSDFDDKIMLLEILNRWKKGDFRQCVKDHNYVWDKQRRYGINMISQYEMWDTIHKMANSKIISEDNRYYGIMQIQTDKVNELIAIVETSDYSDMPRLLDILYRWRIGDFRQCVEDHNYVWDKLGGEVGRAISLMEDVESAMGYYSAPVNTGDNVRRNVGKAVSLTEEVQSAMESYVDSEE